MPDSSEQPLDEELEPNEAEREWQTTIRCFVNTFIGNSSGEQVLKYLKNAFLERTSLNDEGSAYKTIANEGKRFVVLHIIGILEEGMK